MHPNLIRKAFEQTDRINRYSEGKTTRVTLRGVEYRLFVGRDGRVWQKRVNEDYMGNFGKLWMPSHEDAPSSQCINDDRFRVTVWKHPIIASYSKKFAERGDAVAFAQGIVRNDPDRRVTIKDLESGEPVEF